MKKKEYTWRDGLKEVAKEFSIVILVMGLCGVALLIGALIPKKILAVLPFEVMVVLAVVAVLAVLYIASVVVSIIVKIKARMNTRK